VTPTIGEGQLAHSAASSALAKSGFLSWRESPEAVSHGVAVLSVAVALVISRLMDIYLVTAPVSLFLCAVMLSAWFGGVRPGLASVVLSLLAFDYYFVTPIHSFAVETREVPRFISFALSALFVGLLSAAQRSAKESLRHARDNLSKTVQELRITNETLQAENAERKRAENALGRSETYLAQAQKLSLTGSFGWNVVSGKIFWSEETFRIFQYDRPTQPSLELILQRAHPEDAAFVRQTIERAAQDGKNLDFEHRLLMPDGCVKCVHVVARAVSDESNGIEFVGAVMDVTDQHQARAALAGEKRLLEMIARGDSLALILDALCRHLEELSGGGLSSVLLLDPNARCLRHGAAPSLPKKYTEAIDGAVIGPSAGSCGTAAYRGEPVIVSNIATDPLWADYRDLALAHGLRACWSTPIRSTGGRVLGTFATYYREPRSPAAHERDVIEQISHLASIAVERGQAEEVLRKQARLLDLTHDTVFVRDMSDVITYWNRGAEELYGWTREDALDRVSHQLMETIFPTPLPQINAELLRTDRWEGELTHTKRDGTQVVVASRWSLQRADDGRPIAILETNNDVTERKLAEIERVRLAERLRQAEKMEAVGRLAGGIAHDFNNVLGGILAYGEMLFEQAPASSPLKRYAQNVLTAANRGRALIDQILDYSRSQRGKRVPTDLCRTVAETLELVRGSLPDNIDLDAAVPESPLVVIGDATQLHQVVMNLCSNAMHALSSGGTLRVRLTDWQVTEHRALSHGVLSSGHYVCLAVEDSGCGMDPATLVRIFEPFFTTKDVGRGTGLGLSVVYAIVTDLAGAIDVKSAIGQGSTFAIYLPLSEIAVAA
jgi:PAS domain S-box-containing protein